jgi:hypothetical protein
MSAFATRDVALLRRNRLWLSLAILPLSLGPAAIAWGATKGLDDVQAALGLTLGMLGTLGGAIATFYVLRANPMQVPVTGELGVGPEALTFRGRPLALRKTLRAGFMIPSWGKPTLVRLERRWPRRPIDLRTRDDAEAVGLLRDLGLDASQTVAAFTLASRARAEPVVAAAGWALLLLLMFGLPMGVAAFAPDPGMWIASIGGLGVLLLIAWVVVLQLPTRVVVGADGILVSWLWRKRFLAHGDVRAVRPFGSGNAQGVALWSATGAPIKLPVKAQFTHALTDQQTDLVTQRIQQAISAYHGSRRERDVRLPERGGRPLREWIKTLRAAGSGASADHRTAPLASDELWRIVEDPSADRAARAGAAIAVGGGLDERGRARMRIAAEATAAPDVRGLLTLAAEGADEERLERALRRIGER